MIGEFQLIFIIRDKNMVGRLRYTQIPKYMRALVKLLQ